MKITFIGTGAPEGNPSPFCDCINCRYIRKKKGKNIRLSSSLLINDDLLIDFGPDVVSGFNRLGRSMATLAYVLVTHCHFDHFYPANFYHRNYGPRVTDLKQLHVFGPSRMLELSADWLAKANEKQVRFSVIEPSQSFTVDSYRVTSFAITQNDAFAGKGVGYVIEKKGSTLFYAVDTYVLGQQSWKIISKFRYNVVILDETFGFQNPPGRDHLNIPLFLETISRMRAAGLIDRKTKIFTQHMSHHNPPHNKLVHIMAKEGVSVPFDGLTVLC